MKLLNPFLFLALLFHFNLDFVSAQSLAPGDIEFVGFNSAEPDGFAFIALEAIPSATEIFFTDKGWKATNDFSDGEGIIKFTSAGILKGEIVYVEYASSSSNSVVGNGTIEQIEGTFDFAMGGDQLIGYQVINNDTTLVSMIHFAGGDWDSDATNSNSSTMPPDLTNNHTAVALGDIDNAVFVGTFDGDKSTLMARIYNPLNWHQNTRICNLSPDYYPYNIVTSTGANWNLAASWLSNTVPQKTTSVIIPEGYKIVVNSDSAVCNNLILYPSGKLEIADGNDLTVGGSIEIQSRSISISGSLINKGTLHHAGLASVERFIPSSNWHLISSPVAGQGLGDFAVANALESQTTEEITDYDLAPYNESSDEWLPYTLPDETGTFQIGKGYSCRHTVESNVTLLFQGNLNSGDFTDIAVSHDNNGWNCLGNPYPSSIAAKGTTGFLQQNYQAIDPAFLGIYLWDQAQNDYVVITEAEYDFSGNETVFSQNNLASGQGFMIKADSDSLITFNTNMQQDETTASFKSANELWPAIRLTARYDGIQNSTIIAFNEQMSLGLNPMYDIGKFKGNPNLALYSRMPNDPYPDLSVQALPLDELQNVKIPIGVDIKEGREIEFNLEKTDFPEDIEVFLEDTDNATLNMIDEIQSFTTFVSPGCQNRFFMLFENKTGFPREKQNTKDISIKQYNKKLLVSCAGHGNFDIALYDLRGKLIYTKNSCFSQEILNTSDFVSGVYILKVNTNGFFQQEKISITSH